MNSRIENTIRNFSPKHANVLMNAARAAGPDVGSIAKALGEACRLQRLVDFPNPFMGRPEALEWQKNFEPSSPAPTVEPMPEAVAAIEHPNLDDMSKVEIATYVEQQTGVKLNQRLRKDELIQEGIAALEAVAA